MTILWLALVGLICFLGYDVWTVCRAGARLPQALFGAGILCDAAVTVWMLWSSQSALDRLGLRPVLFWGLAVLFLAVLVYTLFFALPFRSTYVDPTQRRPVCRSGMYALCRHPGIIWFSLLYAALYLAVPIPATLWGGAVLCGGNLLYIVVQDLWTFPHTFFDYDAYRKEVPFLIPTSKSLRRALQTWPKRGCRP